MRQLYAFDIGEILNQYRYRAMTMNKVTTLDFLAVLSGQIRRLLENLARGHEIQ